MSESESDASESTATETGGASQGAPDQSVQQQTEGGTSVDDFVSEGEQAIVKEWAIYVTGLFASFAVAIGLNQIIQEQWDHSLVSFSGSAGQALNSASSLVFHAGNLYTIMMLGLLVSVAVGVALGRVVDNTENTAYKTGAATSIIGMPVLLVLGTFMYTIQLDNVDPEFVNLLVSGLGAGIAATVGCVIAIYLTEEYRPSALH